jgi:predicted AAA+ superfamily ATPase
MTTRFSSMKKSKFSNYLEAVYLTFFLRRFSFKFKKKGESPRNVYIIDAGLSNIAGFRLTQAETG